MQVNAASRNDIQFSRTTGRTTMTESNLDRGVIFILRILLGWTFLYACL
jgi:hypothetical protein